MWFPSFAMLFAFSSCVSGTLVMNLLAQLGVVATDITVLRTDTNAFVNSGSAGLTDLLVDYPLRSSSMTNVRHLIENPYWFYKHRFGRQGCSDVSVGKSAPNFLAFNSYLTLFTGGDDRRNRSWSHVCHQCTLLTHKIYDFPWTIDARGKKTTGGGLACCWADCTCAQRYLILV